MKKIAIYSRKSKFVEGSESVENQIEMCKDYTNKNLINIKDIVVYEDEGFSGSNIDRPNFTRMMQDAKNKKFDVLICYRLDRISRNIKDFTNIISELQNVDIDFISIKEQFDTSSPMGRAMMYISSVFAQLERETIAERIRDNMIELAKEGRWLGGKEPLGYKKVGQGKNAILEIDKQYFETVIKMFEKYIEYNSLAQVHKWTIRENIKTKEGKYFNVNSVRRILINPVYCIGDLTFYNYAKKHNMKICNDLETFKTNAEYGIMCYNKQKENAKKVELREKNEWIISIGNHKGIINSDLWIMVQNKIAENADKAPREGQSQDALLGGLLRCAECGGTFRVIANYRGGERRQHYYKCRTKSNSNTLLCNIKNIDGTEADKAIFQFIRNMAKEENLIEEYYNANKKSNDKSTVTELSKLEKALCKNKSNIEKLTEKLILAETSAASKYIIEKIEKLDAEIKDINIKINQLKDIQEQSKMQELNLKIYKQIVKNTADNWDNFSIDEKKQAIKETIKYVTWDGTKLDITPKI